MKYSFLARLRDVLFVCSLLFLLKAAYNRTFTFLAEHKESVIHELDRSFIDQIYTAQRQIHYLEQHPEHSGTFGHTIADIKARLVTIEEKYKKNSPGLIFLGPIGSAAIVAKEEKLHQQLISVLFCILSIILKKHLYPHKQLIPHFT